MEHLLYRGCLFRTVFRYLRDDAYSILVLKDMYSMRQGQAVPTLVKRATTKACPYKGHPKGVSPSQIEPQTYGLI